MDPDLAARLRRFGEQVDQAAIAAQAGRTPTPSTEPDDTGELAPVVPFVATAPGRRFRMITAAAAAAIVVLGGALVTWRVVGDDELAPAESGPSTVDTTARPSTTVTTTSSTVVPTTTSLPAIPLGGPTSTSTSSTSTTTSTPPPTVAATAPAASQACPNGYDPYGAEYPIRLCDEGPAVVLIQQRVDAPDVDGYFGPATQQSVRAFQGITPGLEVDGLVGPETWAAMFQGGAPGTDADGNGTVDPWEVP